MSIVVACTLFTIMALFDKHHKLNCLLIFNMLWLVVYILSKLGLYGIYQASSKAYIIIFVGILAFDIGYCVCNKVVHFTTKKRENCNESINYNVILAFCVLAGILYAKDLMVTLPRILSGNGLEIIRQMAQNSESELYSSRGGIENALRILFLNPFMVSLQPIVSVDFWMGKRNKTLLLADVVLCILNMLSDGSRTCLLYLVISFAVVYFYSKKYLEHLTFVKKRLIRKRKRVFTICVAFGVVILTIATFSRSGTNTIRYMYYYYAMEPYMLGEWVDKIDQMRAYGYGFSSLCGYAFPAIYLIKNLLRLDSYPQFIYNIVLTTASTDQEWITISSMGSPANAYVSLFWFPYFDGRFLGLIIVMLLYGMLIKQMYLRAIKDGSLKYISLYALLFIGVFMCYVRFQTAQTAQALAYIYILLMFKNRRQNNN